MRHVCEISGKKMLSTTLRSISCYSQLNNAVSLDNRTLPSPRVGEGRQINVELRFPETSGQNSTTGVGNLLQRGFCIKKLVDGVPKGSVYTGRESGTRYKYNDQNSKSKTTY